jgi:sulfite exporter TauE/SafE
MDPATKPFDFLILLTMGFTISLGHCIGMCGPLVSAFTISQQQRLEQGKSRGAPLWIRTLVYNLGRVMGYGLLGVAMGLLGSTVFLAGQGRSIQGGLSLAVGVGMLLLGLGILGFLRVPRWVTSSAWQRTVSCRVRGLLAAETTPRCWALGFANAFLPCGPVLAAAMTAAATSSVWKGAVAMLAFGLGTVPVMFALGVSTGTLSVRLRSFFNRVGAILVMLVGLQLLLRGLSAWGVISHLRFGEVVIW